MGRRAGSPPPLHPSPALKGGQEVGNCGGSCHFEEMVALRPRWACDPCKSFQEEALEPKCLVRRGSVSSCSYLLFFWRMRASQGL